MTRTKRRYTEAVATVPGAPTATVDAIAAEPAPLLLVVKLDRDPGEEICSRIRSAVEGAFNGAPHPPVVVLVPGIEIEAVLDPRHKDKICTAER